MTKILSYSLSDAERNHNRFLWADSLEKNTAYLWEPGNYFIENQDVIIGDPEGTNDYSEYTDMPIVLEKGNWHVEIKERYQGSPLIMSTFEIIIKKLIIIGE